MFSITLAVFPMFLRRQGPGSCLTRQRRSSHRFLWRWRALAGPGAGSGVIPQFSGSSFLTKARAHPPCASVHTSGSGSPAHRICMINCPWWTCSWEGALNNAHCFSFYLKTVSILLVVLSSDIQMQNADYYIMQKRTQHLVYCTQHNLCKNMQTIALKYWCK